MGGDVGIEIGVGGLGLHIEIEGLHRGVAPKMAERRGVSFEEFRAEVKAKGGVSFHTIRHTAATRDAEAGFTDGQARHTISELQHKYRWSDARMVQRYIYGNDEWSEKAAMKRAEAEG